MKTNMTRLLSLVLVLLLAIGLFAGCKADDPVTKTDLPVEDAVSLVDDVVIDVEDLAAPFTVEKLEGKDIVILTPGEDDSVVVTVAENTTLETFLSVVKAEAGYAVKVLDANGAELTDVKALIAKGMKFEIYADGATQPEISYVIDVISEEKIEETVKEQEKVDDTNSQIIANQPGKKPESKDPASDDEPSGPSSTPSSKDGDPEIVPTDIIFISTGAVNYEASDANGKAWQYTLKNMKEKKGFNTTILPIDSLSATDIIVKEVMAGKASGDVYQVSIGTCRNAARKKAVANMYDSKTLKKELFNSANTKSCTFNGKAYGVAFPGQAVNPMGVIYNKDLIKKYAPDYDIDALFKSKKWDFNTFREIAKLCTRDTDGNGRTDVYGFTSNTNIIGMALTSNAGGTATMENGRVVAAMCSDAGITALQWCKDMYGTDKSWKYQADIMACIDSFTSQDAAMFVSYFQYYQWIAGASDFNLGFVLMPMGPDQTDYKNGTYDGAVYMVTKTKESRLDDVGRWLNELTTVSSKLVNNFVTSMARHGFDANSQAIYKWLVNNMSPEYGSGPFSAETSGAVDGSVTNAASSPKRVMESIKSQAQKECDDYYAPLYE